jgi:hypothetical protein
MATYGDIQKDVKKRYGKTVKTCWIAHVKELNGLPLRKAPNRYSPSYREVPCPEAVRPMIDDSMRRLGVL